SPHDDLMTVAHTMTERRIRHLPVVDKGRLIGIVSIGDIVKTQRDKYQGELDTLQAQVVGESGAPEPLMAQAGTEAQPLRVAIIGGGRTGDYAAGHLLRQHRVTVEGDRFYRLRSP